MIKQQSKKWRPGVPRNQEPGSTVLLPVAVGFIPTLAVSCVQEKNTNSNTPMILRNYITVTEAR